MSHGIPVKDLKVECKHCGCMIAKKRTEAEIWYCASCGRVRLEEDEDEK
jgi:ribosomal protein L37AE/L43A